MLKKSAIRKFSVQKVPTEHPVGTTLRSSLYNTLGVHGVGNFQETGDVCAGYIVALHAVLLGSGIQVVEDVHHDVLQLGVHFLKGPAQALGVLGHLQSGGGYAAGVGSFAGAEEDSLVL